MLSLPELRAAARIDLETEAEDSYLRGLEKAAVAHFQRRTGRYFGPVATHSEIHTGYGVRNIWLADTPRPGTLVVSRDGVEVAATEYELRERELVSLSAWGRVTAPVDITVTYERGYPAGTEPAEVKQAVAQIVALWYSKRLPVSDGGSFEHVPYGAEQIIRSMRRGSIF